MTGTARTRLYPLRCLIAVAAILSGIQYASAARIYNFTNQPIHIQAVGKNGWHIDLKAGQRSESLERGAPVLNIHHPFAEYFGVPVCKFEWGNTRELVGGNYLIIVQHGTKVSCTLCDAGRKGRYQSSGKVKIGYEYTAPNRPEHGCE